MTRLALRETWTADLVDQLPHLPPKVKARSPRRADAMHGRARFAANRAVKRRSTVGDVSGS